MNAEYAFIDFIHLLQSADLECGVQTVPSVFTADLDVQVAQERNHCDFMRLRIDADQDH